MFVPKWNHDSVAFLADGFVAVQGSFHGDSIFNLFSIVHLTSQSWSFLVAYPIFWFIVIEDLTLFTKAVIENFILWSALSKVQKRTKIFTMTMNIQNITDSIFFANLFDALIYCLYLRTEEHCIFGPTPVNIITF